MGVCDVMLTSVYLVLVIQSACRPRTIEWEITMYLLLTTEDVEGSLCHHPWLSLLAYFTCVSIFGSKLIFIDHTLKEAGNCIISVMFIFIWNGHYGCNLLRLTGKRQRILSFRSLLRNSLFLRERTSAPG